MIYTTASLSLLLASAQTALAAPRDVTAALKVTKTKEMHAAVSASLLDKLKAAPRRPVTKNIRALYSNEYFLNLYMSSDEGCTKTPFSNAGIGMGSCIPEGDGSSYILGCSGPDSAIAVTIMGFANEDCSGVADESSELVVEGDVCQPTDVSDDDIIDDRLFFLGNNAYYTASCDTSRSAANNGVDITVFEDDTCSDGKVTGYYGINYDTCFPAGYTEGGDPIYGVYTCPDTFNAFSDELCTVSIAYNDDGDDDDGDDGLSPGAGECVPVPTVNTTLVDDYAYPGAYYSGSLSACADDSGDDDTCFAGSETVLLESGATKAISDVEVGDTIQVVSADGSLAFSEVVFLPHGANTQKALFSELELASGNSLRATPTHFVLAGACGADAFHLTAMQDVAEGSCVQTAGGEDEVTGIGHVIDHGVYTVITKESSGLIVVNGVRASSFGNNHWLVNNYYNIHRALYEVAPSLMKNRDVVAANLIVGDIAMSL
jgi:hypothetical protein